MNIEVYLLSKNLYHWKVQSILIPKFWPPSTITTRLVSFKLPPGATEAMLLGTTPHPIQRC